MTRKAGNQKTASPEGEAAVKMAFGCIQRMRLLLCD